MPKSDTIPSFLTTFNRKSADFNRSFRYRYSSNLKSLNLSIRVYAVFFLNNFMDREYRLIILPNTVYTHKMDRHCKHEMSSDTKMDDDSTPTTEVNPTKNADDKTPLSVTGDEVDGSDGMNTHSLSLDVKGYVPSDGTLASTD